MDEKDKNKKSKIEESSLGSSLEPNKMKKEKHKERKKKHGTDKTLDSNETVGGNCIGDAGERQACSIDGKFTGNREEGGKISKKKKKKGRKDTDIADDKVVEILDDNQNSKMKKRKNCNDSLTGMHEMGASRPSKKRKMTGDNDFKNDDGDPPLDRISAGDANAHSLVNEVDGQGKKMKKKKKLSEKCKRIVEGYKSNDIDHFVVAEERQDKEMEKKLSKKVKSTEGEECKTNEGDRCFAESIVVDPPLVTSNEGEDDDQGKKMKKKKKKKKSLSDKSKCKEKSEFKSNEGEVDSQGKKMKKRKLSDKSKSKESDEVDDQGKKMKRKKKTKAGPGESPNSAPGGTSKPKRVTFSDQVEVCCDGLIRGKRFTPEEDETIKQAVLDYIESHGLGDEGLNMVLYCRSHPDVRHCWKEIGAALPYRPYSSVYYRAHILFERGEKRKWTAEELEFIKKVQEQHGSDWKSIAEALGKNRFHVKDAWRRIKYINIKRGSWSQEEYQQLFDLVNLDLRARALEEYRKAKHGMLRDNISWEAIGNKLATRTSSRCCKKWYEQLTSPMVAQGVWSDTDDYRLINALFVLDACCMEEVDWDNLLEHRSGDVCRQRWNQMVRHIGEHGRKSFAEQVETLAKRFCPDLVEEREAFDSKPVIC